MSLTKPQFLLDLNVLIALADPDSIHYQAVQKWFDHSGHINWGVCPLTEAGFVRVTTNPTYRGPNRTIAQATFILAEFASHPGYRYWPITENWTKLIQPFAARVFGHQQVTDAYLLALVIQQDGILVTFDKGIRYLAGTTHQRHLLVLGS